MTRSCSPSRDNDLEKDVSLRLSPPPSLQSTTPQLLPDSQDLSALQLTDSSTSLPPDLVQHACSLGLPVDSRPELLPRAAKYLSTFTAALSARGPAPRRPGRPARPTTMAHPLLALQITAQDLNLDFPTTAAIRRSTLPVRAYQTTLDLFRTTLGLRTPEGPSIQTLSVRYGCPMAIDAQVKDLKDTFLPRWYASLPPIPRQAAQAASREKQGRAGGKDEMDSPSLACFICICRVQKVNERKEDQYSPFFHTDPSLLTYPIQIKIPLMEVLHMATEPLPVMRRWIKLVEEQCPEELSALAAQTQPEPGSRKRGRPPKAAKEGLQEFSSSGSSQMNGAELPPAKRGPGRPRKVTSLTQEANVVLPVKRGPGRPRKVPLGEVNDVASPVKRGPGRPRKVPLEGTGDLASPIKRGPGRPRKARPEEEEEEVVVMKERIGLENSEEGLKEDGRTVHFDPDSPFVSKEDTAGSTEAEVPKKRGRGRPRKSEVGSSVSSTPKSQRASFMEKLRSVVAAQDDTEIASSDLNMTIALAPPVDGLNPMVGMMNQCGSFPIISPFLLPCIIHASLGPISFLEKDGQVSPI
ncbi:MAG: hypothetical protein DHS80DRAFT_20988 [Piptocephalis tieghemiana]|nr:MAG: hypothetical protein DHS80DRAFT_20988 [Piptocephalis tieghemiana]